jgi:hypothetical protein
VNYKTILLTGLFLLFFVNISSAQEKKEQNKDQKKTKQKIEIKLSDKSKIKAVPVNPDSLKGFIDANANGIDDRIEFRQDKKGKSKKSDKFIDLNGDGICDGRESALGLKKTARNRKGPGGKK